LPRRHDWEALGEITRSSLPHYRQERESGVNIRETGLSPSDYPDHHPAGLLPMMIVVS
jgi:hypothetical protein